MVLFHLSPNCTYLTQPFDIKVFKPFKHYYIDAIDKVVRLEDEKFYKFEFVAIFQSFYYYTFKPITIYYIFKLTG